MIINNKIESYNKIIELNLNKFPEKLFESHNVDEIEKFLDKYPANYYAIRDKTKPNGIFKLKVKRKEVLKETKEYKLFTINISSINYAKNQLLVGEILISSNNQVYLTLSTDKYASVRDAINNPIFNMKSNIYDKKLNKIPNFNYIYDYIIKHNLQDIIVEFALFNINLGINNDKIIIYKLRTEY